MAERDELEQRLLRNPFDAEIRVRYGQLLLAANETEAALVQFDLLCQQRPNSALGDLGAARALAALGRGVDALSRYDRARGLSDFEADTELERSLQLHKPETLRLRIIDGPTAENVIPLQRAPDERVRFSSIVGMEDLKQTLRVKIIEPFRNPGLFQRFRKRAGGGVLLYGPPGCGKTMIARAIANECEAEFISVGISDVLNMWIGQSERNLAVLFEKARSQAPCVLFFDEIDALAYSRSKAQSEHTRTIVNEFLTQLDGMGNDNREVLILAATNMPWDVDTAMKRPGRFSRQIFVPPPDAEARRQMLQLKLTGVPQEAINYPALAQGAAHFSGADMDGLIELAKENAIQDALLSRCERPLRQADFVQAFKHITPSTLEWLRTARNLVKYAGEDGAYRDVEAYLKKVKLM